MNTKQLSSGPVTKEEVVQIVTEIVSGAVETIGVRLEGIEHRLESKIDESIDALAMSTQKGFEEVHKKFEEVDKRFDRLEERISNVEYHGLFR